MAAQEQLARRFEEEPPKEPERRPVKTAHLARPCAPVPQGDRGQGGRAPGGCRAAAGADAGTGVAAARSDAPGAGRPGDAPLPRRDLRRPERESLAANGLSAGLGKAAEAPAGGVISRRFPPSLPVYPRSILCRWKHSLRRPDGK